MFKMCAIIFNFRFVSIVLNCVILVLASDVGAPEGVTKNIVPSAFFPYGNAELDCVFILLVCQLLREVSICYRALVLKRCLSILIRMFFIVSVFVSFNMLDMIETKSFSFNIFKRYERVDYWEVQACFWLIVLSNVLYFEEIEETQVEDNRKQLYL